MPPRSPTSARGCRRPDRIRGQRFRRLRPPVAEAFRKSLVAKGNTAETLEVKNHNHITVMMNAGMPAGKAFQEIVKFIREQSAK